MELKDVHIYTLSCPISGDIRYVGITSRTLSQRFKEHLNKFKSDHKSFWIKSLLRKRLSPVIELIDTVEYSHWQFWEQHYICLFRSWGFSLTNKSVGGYGALGVKLTSQQRNRLSEIRKEYFRLNPDKKNDLNNRLTPEQREQGRLKLIGQVTTQQKRDKLSKLHKGRKKNTEPMIDSLRREVYQYDLLGNLVDKHWGVARTAKKIGVTQSGLSRAIERGSVCCGFRWSYTPPNNLIPEGKAIDATSLTQPKS